MTVEVIILQGPTGKSFWRGRLSAVDLLVLTSLDQLFIYIENIINLFYKTSYLNEEVNCTEPFPLVSIPWILSCAYASGAPFKKWFQALPTNIRLG